MKVDDRTALLAVAKGEIDAFDVSDPDVAIAASKSTDPNVRFVKSRTDKSPFVLWFNMRRKPLDDWGAPGAALRHRRERDFQGPVRRAGRADPQLPAALDVRLQR